MGAQGTHKGLPFATALLVAVVCFSPLAADCNQNGIADASDIASNSSVDCNANGVPDECETQVLRFAAADMELEFERLPRGGAVFGDFSGDGQTDVAFGTRAALDSSVTVFLNAELLVPGPPRRYEAGRGLASVAAEDLDADGDLDLVTANSSTLQYLSNRGDGTFAQPTPIPVRSGTRFVSAADLDADGLPELIATTTASDVVSVLHNVDGEYGEARSYPTGSDPVAVAALDADGDGQRDLATANRGDSSVSLLLADDQGGFLPVRPHAVSTAVFAVEAADLDGDGRDELCAFGSSAVTILERPGSELAESVAYPASITSPQLIDLEGDGDLDIFYFDLEVSAAAALVQLGAGRFAPATTLAAVTRADWAKAGDLDGDGDVELIVVKTLARSAALFRGGELGELTMTAEAYPLAQRPHGGVLADFNGDEHLDVLSSNGHQQSVSTILGFGDGTFSRPRAFEAIGANVHHQFFWPRAADFDRDGDLDVVVSDDDSSYLIVIFNSGAGEFGNEVPYDAGFRTTSVAVADLNHDSYPDLLGTTAGDNVGVLLNAGDATFVAAEGIAVGRGPGAIETGDWDGDGRVDFAVANVSSQDISVVSERDGRFVEVERLPVSGRPSRVVSGRFDGDAFSDLAAIAGEQVTVLFGTGSGTFSRSTSFDAGLSGRALAAADPNGDGLEDLVTAGGASNRAAVLLGGGDGTFAPARFFDVGVEPRFVVAGDIDRDGDSDLISGNRVTQDVTVLLNQSGVALFPADSVESICTERQFGQLARASSGRVVATLDYVAPKSDDPELLPTAFTNSRRFSSHREFLVDAHEERFGAITQDDFESRFVHPERRYFAGSVARVRTEGGGFAYGATLLVESGAAAELEEVRGLLRTLREHFHLRPLGFLAESRAQREAVSRWTDPGFSVFVVEERDETEALPDAFPSFLLEIPTARDACATFGLAGADRGPREEYLHKSRVRFRAGTIELATAEDTFEATIVDELIYGAGQEIAEPVGPGVFRVRRLAGAEGITHYRFTYEQEFVQLSGRRLSFLLASPLTYEARGEEPVIETRRLDDTFFVAPPGGESFQLRVDDVLLVRYGSCSYGALPRWEISAALEDGTTLRLEERWEPAVALDASGPAGLVRAELTLAGETILVEDYWHLIYSANRHNVGVRHWVVLEPPRSLPGLEELVHAVELVGPNALLGTTHSASYLGPGFAALAMPRVTSYSRAAVGEAVPFRRGDVGADGRLDVTDALRLLSYVFRRDTEISCRKAGDLNDDGRLNLLDPVALVQHLFAERPLPAPSSSCGADPTADELSCPSFAACP